MSDAGDPVGGVHAEGLMPKHPTRCRSRSEYGDCGRPGKHGGPHAVPVGPDFWFGYIRDGQRVTLLGYGHLRGDTFEPVGRRSA